MALLKYRAFNKMLKEVKTQKELEKLAESFKKVYNERLSAYGVTDASQLDEEQLAEFLEGMKSYKKNKQTNETTKF
jgi:hypothetical protein